MTEPRPSPRREDLPFRRIALVLSGGGALGAYEVGVLKVLEMAGIRRRNSPSIVRKDSRLPPRRIRARTSLLACWRGMSMYLTTRSVWAIASISREVTLLG